MHSRRRDLSVGSIEAVRALCLEPRRRGAVLFYRRTSLPHSTRGYPPFVNRRNTPFFPNEISTRDSPFIFVYLIYLCTT